MTDPPQDAAAAPQDNEADETRSRRAFLRGTAKKAAYAAPLALLFRPSQAMASPTGELGSDLTNMDPSKGTIRLPGAWKN